MSVDLYKDDLNSLGGTDLYAAVEALIRLQEMPADRLSEGWILDYKEQWSDEMLKHVAAFANTFGGLLLVGVSERDGKPHEIIGVQLKSELKTQIASGISANISPTPSFDIGECLHPKDPTRRIAVVRIRNIKKLHYFMKGDRPVYVRNEDESRPANAAQLRSLVEQRAHESTPIDLGHMLKELSSKFYVSRANQAGTYQERRLNRARSTTSFTALLYPLERQSFPFDASTENLFDDTLSRNFPEVAQRWNDESAVSSTSRGRDWYGVEFWQPDLDFEMNWLLSEREVALAAQVNVPVSGFGDSWSIADMALNIAFLMRSANAVWTAMDFHGEAGFACELKVEGLQLYQATHGYHSIFYNTELSFVPAIIKGGSLKTSVARADLETSFVSRASDRSTTVAAITNQMLRGLAYSADIETIRVEVARLLMLVNRIYPSTSIS